MARRVGFWLVLPILSAGWYHAGQAAWAQAIQLIPAQPGIVVDGKPAEKPVVGGTKASQLSAIKRVEKSELRQVINAARECIKDKAWGEAVTALQSLLDQKEDHQVQIREKDAVGNETLRWTSVKFEANNLLATMPKEGLETYEVRVGAKARERLDEAKRKGDKEMIAEVAQRFCHAKAGTEANELLATLALARGQYFMAALFFDKILTPNVDRPQPADTSLFKAALAYKRSGEIKKSQELWKKLETNLKETGGLKVGDKIVSLSQLEDVLSDETKDPEATAFVSWPMVRGNVTHTAQAVGSPPLLDQVLWRHLLFDESVKSARSIYSDKRTKEVVDAAIQQMTNLKHPILPGSFPIVTQGKVFFRSYLGIRGYHLQGGTNAKGAKVEPGSLFFDGVEDRASLTYLLNTNETRGSVEQWLNTYTTQFPGSTSMLYENSLIGTLSTDHRHLFAISDLAVPSPPQQINPYMVPQQTASGEIRKYVSHNELQAFNVADGKLKWVLGGPEDTIFSYSHFLGAPISVGGKLYVLNEKGPSGNNQVGDAELRLVCLDPNKPSNDPHRPFIVEPIQSLGMVQQMNRITHQTSRRTNAVHLGFGEGILICPTNAGEVFGVDLLTRSLVWSYPYREQAPPETASPGMAMGLRRFPGPNPILGNMTLSNWKSAPPAIVDGKVVFTAPDAQSVHCINLRDGTPLWKSKQVDGDLYMAGVFTGRVLIVSKNSIRALDLKSGAEMWRLSTGDLPSGQGVASRNIYYLPLMKGEILAVDVEKGVVKAHNRAASERVVPGNLVFHDGMVVSLTPTELAAYPQLTSRLDFARKALEGDPGNLEKRTNFGELLLKDGQVQAAVTDLLAVLEKRPEDPLAKRAKDRLFEAFTDLFQLDFNGASQRYLKDYEELTKLPENPADQQKRQAVFFELMGQGREAQGDLVEAFKMYKDFGSLPMHREQGGVSSLQDPNHKIPTNVWLRGRISNMMAKAKPDQREPLEKQIAQEWQHVESKKDPDAIRSFVGMFDVPFRVGREARLKLAEAILERNERGAFLEAELYLHQLRSGEFRKEGDWGGRALASLALLEEKKGSADSMRLAADYYRELGRDYPNILVRKDRTGADLFNDLATDKRFLPFLEEAGTPWGQVKLAARELRTGGAPVGGFQGFMFQPDGDQTPFARQHRLVIDPSANPSNPTIRLVDVTTQNTRWSQNLGFLPFNNQIFHQLYQMANMNQEYHPDARFRFFHVKGHLVVGQVGIMTYCLDGDTGKLLWKESMAPGLENQQNLAFQQVINDADGNPELVLWNPQLNRPMRVYLGQIGSVQASYVALMTQQGLLVKDPLQGNIMWKKPDVANGSRIFGDEQNIFLIEGTDNGPTGAGRVLRAIDGVAVNAPDFSQIYQNRIRILDNRILASKATKEGFGVHLYDILSGKDLWSKTYPAGTIVAKTEDEKIAAVMAPGGKVSVLSVDTGKEIFAGNVVQGRISEQDVKTLKDPIVLADAERFYVVLNQQVDNTKIAQGMLHNNFQNGIRCLRVNGWVVALHRKDGTQSGEKTAATWKSGDLAWHSYAPIQNQMLVTEMFDQMPIMLFTCRYNELIRGGQSGNRWWTNTQSLSKRTGKMIYDPGPMNSNSTAQFSRFGIDFKNGSIFMQGVNFGVQHYIDDGKEPPAVKTGAIGVNSAAQLIEALAPGVLGNRVIINQGRVKIDRIIRRDVNIVPQDIAPPKVEVKK